MSSGVEGPLDRLNYFNGQRLAAPDLRVEQDYHIRIRRWLNRALVTPGIADGLEVRVSPSSARTVIVSPGLAIDASGREVILIEETAVNVVGVPSTEDDWVFGNYLTIAYAEETVASVQDGCSVKTDRCDLSWGGPTLIRATPVLAFQGAWPDESSGKILLAQVELGAGCEVTRIHSGVRKYVDAATPSVRSFALEGEKDVDRRNPKVLSFHIRGGPPASVLLYLRGARLSTLFYTELPAHTHPVNLVTDDRGGDATGHTHEVVIGDVTSGEEPGHDHSIEGRANVDSGDIAFRLINNGVVVNLSNLAATKTLNAGKHSHLVSLGTIESAPSGTSSDHRHRIAGQETAGSGVTDDGSGGARTSGSELTYLRGLTVYLDANEITSAVLAQLGGPAAGWAQLGDGTGAHPLVASGTGAIDLLRLDHTLVEGEHTLELKVDNNSGGNIRYNLYVE